MIQLVPFRFNLLVSEQNSASARPPPTRKHYGDVIMGVIASQITSVTIVYSTVYSDADQRKHQSSASLAFVWGIHRGPVNSPHKWPVKNVSIWWRHHEMSLTWHTCISRCGIVIEASKQAEEQRWWRQLGRVSLHWDAILLLYLRLDFFPCLSR